MKTTQIGSCPLVASRIAYGCWRIADHGSDPKIGQRAVLAAVESGFTLFDHADIYCDGEAEKLFGRVLKESPGLRERVVIATKCGIRKPADPQPASPYRYDFSPEYILRSCDGSLQRLGIETIDIYQLHRPDYLMHPHDVAGAFEKLHKAGKVREFGVSNFKPSQVVALQSACPMRLVVNQVEISLANLTCLEDGTLDQCIAERIMPMAWSPLAGGKLGDGPRRLLPAQEAYRTEGTVAALDALAKARGANRTAVALAWLLRHPAGIVPIVGSTDAGRIREAAQADTFEMSHEEWYRLLEPARGEKLA
jgi:predicted oxidoreductase